MSPDGSGVGGASVLMSVAFPLLLVGGVALVVYGIVTSYRNAKRRRSAIAATVAAHNLGYVAADPARTAYFASHPFSLGDHRKATDVVWGTLAGGAFETFAYSYETHTTDARGNRSTTTHRFQVTWVPLAASVSTMRLTPDNALWRLFATMGARDLNVESKEFNDRWKVWCESERLGHAMLTPRMIERFLAPDVAGRGFVFEGAALMTYVSGVSNLGDLEAVVAMLREIVALIPGFLLDGPEDASPGT
jgi:hypothetical protein